MMLRLFMSGTSDDRADARTRGIARERRVACALHGAATRLEVSMAIFTATEWLKVIAIGNGQEQQ